MLQLYYSLYIYEHSKHIKSHIIIHAVENWVKNQYNPNIFQMTGISIQYVTKYIALN